MNTKAVPPRAERPPTPREAAFRQFQERLAKDPVLAAIIVTKARDLRKRGVL